MTTDQLTPEQKAASPFFATSGTTRLGLRRCRSSRGATTLRGVPGRFGWDGGYGTSGVFDPTEDMVGILMTQRVWDSPKRPGVLLDFWTSAYQAIDD